MCATTKGTSTLVKKLLSLAAVLSLVLAMSPVAYAEGLEGDAIEEDATLGVAAEQALEDEADIEATEGQVEDAVEVVAVEAQAEGEASAEASTEEQDAIDAVETAGDAAALAPQSDDAGEFIDDDGAADIGQCKLYFDGQASANHGKTFYVWYTGEQVKPAITVRDSSQYALVAGTDYQVTYTNNVKAGTGTVTVTGMGGWTGSLKSTFEIRYKFASASVATIKTQRYTGKAVTPKPAITWGGTTLTRGTDYALSYTNNVKVGTATVTITGKGLYRGSVKRTFEIQKTSIAKATVSTIKTKTYKGKAIKPKPTVKLGTKTLTLGTDYKLTYKNNNRAGKATVIITGKGLYRGTIKKTFVIRVSVARATVSTIKTQVLGSRSAVKPRPTVKIGSVTLKRGTHYTLTYKNNTKAGTATIYIKGKGAYYYGTKKVTFKIV